MCVCVCVCGSRESGYLSRVERVSREDVEIVPETLEIKPVEPQPQGTHGPASCVCVCVCVYVCVCVCVCVCVL